MSNYDYGTTGSITFGNHPGTTANNYQFVTYSPEVFYTETPAGTESHLHVVENKGKGEIGVNLFMRYVKSKLSPMQKEIMAQRMRKLQKMVQSAYKTGQKALYEQLAIMLAIIVRESEAYACGIRYWVKKDEIEKFISRVKEKAVEFKKLEDFPRIVPAEVRLKVDQFKKIFDEFHVLYIDYTKEVVKTNKEKIREKDPILFGCYSYQPDKFYHITEWTDEYCDLTITEMVDKMKEKSPKYQLHEIPEMDEKMIETIKKEVNVRFKRLSEAKSSNYRQHMRDEDNDEIKKSKKKGILDRLKRKKK